jgi:serine phosphatase RsbU (regulator of sigma subunit)
MSGKTFLHTPKAAFALLLVMFCLLLVQAIRRRNRIATGFLWLQVGYWLLHVAVAPPAALLASSGFVPAYRLIIGLALIVMVIRQSVGDRNERQRLAAEVAAARAVQQVLFPDATTGNIEAVYRPAAEVGGDFWQAIPAKDGAQILAIGDVSGKGLKAAMIVSLLTGALRNRHSDRPAAILGELNRVAASMSGGGFVTAAVARVEGASVTIANAGHPQPWLNRCEVSLEPGLPLGIDAETTYTEREILLDGQLVFVSDGVIEAANASGELFGFERVGEISAKSAPEIADAAQAWGQNDDITVVTVRRSA